MAWDYINNTYTCISIIYIYIKIYISISPSFFFSSKIGQFYNCNEMWQAVHFWGIIACLECIRQKKEYLTSDTKVVESSTRNALEWFGTSYCFYKTQNYTLLVWDGRRLRGKGVGGGGGLKAQNKGESNTSLFSEDQQSGSSISAHWTLLTLLNLFPVVQHCAAVA